MLEVHVPQGVEVQVLSRAPKQLSDPLVVGLLFLYLITE